MGTITTFLLREGKSALKHKINCKVILVPSEIVPTRMGVKKVELVVTLKKSKPTLKQITRCVIRVHWTRAKYMPKPKKKMSILDILNY